MDLENPALEPGMTAAPMLPPAAPIQAAVAQTVPTSFAARARQQAATGPSARPSTRPRPWCSPSASSRWRPTFAPCRRPRRDSTASGVLDRLQNSRAYEQARTRLDLACSAFGKAEAMLEGRQAQMLQDARRLFESRSESPAPQATPAGPVIEMDPRHQRTATKLGG